MKNKNIPIFLITTAIFILIFLTQSCKKDLNLNKVVNPQWKPYIVFPLVKTKLTLYNLLKPDSNLIFKPDSSIKVIYSNSLNSIVAGDIVKIPDQNSDSEEFHLGEIKIKDFSFNSNVNLDTLKKYFSQEVQDSINANAGDSSIFPALQLINPYNFNILPIDEYNTLTFSQGYLIFSITDSLPVALNNIKIYLKNTSDNSIIDSLNIPTIEPSSTKTDSINLSGTTMSNDLTAEMTNLSSPGSYPDSVLINLDNRIYISAHSHNVKVISGEAKIPSQILYSETHNITFDVKDSAQLKHINFSFAKINYSIQSDIQTSFDIKLKLLSSNINGSIPINIFKLNPNDSSSKTWDLSGINIDLTTDSLIPYNTIPVEYELSIDSSETIIPFDSSNFVSINSILNNLTFSFIDGYFGKKNIDIDPDSIDFNIDFLQKIQGGLILDNPKIKLSYTNSIGIPLAAKFDFTGKSISGNTENLNKDTIYFNYPTQSGDIINDSVIIDKNNSNIVNLISISPNSIYYSGSAAINTFGSPDNFIADTSKINIGFDIDLPLVLSISNLIFQDTMDMKYNGDDFDNFDSVFIYINAINGFPLKTNLNLIVLDSLTSQPLDTIIANTLEPATIDEQGKVVEPKENNLTIQLNKKTFDNITSSDRMIIRAKMSTPNNEQGKAVTIYTYHSINVNIGIKVKIHN